MNIIFAISILLAFYVIMLLTIVVVNRRRPGFASHHASLDGNLKILNNLHATGIIIMLLPAWIISPLPVFLLSLPGKITTGQLISFLACFAAIGFFPWKKSGNEVHHKRTDFLPAQQIILYALLRTVFLAVYEWFFRGLLLMIFFKWVGMSWAILINITLYTLVHFHQHKKEIISCIPFGLLLCVFTIWWQSIWPAIIFHLQIALLNEWPKLHRLLSPQKRPIL